MNKITFAFFSLLLTCTAIAESPASKGLKIARAAEAQDAGFRDTTANMVMILQDGHGGSVSRNIRIKTLEIRGDGDKSLALFDSPADVRGSVMLTFSHGRGSDDQWLYLPALRRVKRISSSNKSGAFMGSEFSYEDLGSGEVNKYSYNFLRVEPCGNGWKCNVMERFPRYGNSGYSRQVIWLDTRFYRPTKVIYYDRNGSILKTLSTSGFRNYLGRYWRPSIMRMVNHQSNRVTTLRWANYRFRTGLSTVDFNKNALADL